MRKQVLLLFLVGIQFSLFAKNKTWTCINENGESLFRIEAAQVFPFYNGLAKFRQVKQENNTWVKGYGFINQKGEVVIQPDLKEAKDFKSTVTWVKHSGSEHFELINQKGEVIPTKPYDKVKPFYSFQQDLAAVFLDGKMGFVNTKGEEVIPCKYRGSATFFDGLVSVSLADDEVGMYGYINKQGELVIDFQFPQSGVSNFKNGLARAKVGGKTVLINVKGETMFKTDKGNIQGHAHGLVLVQTKPGRKGWGWLDFEDEYQIKPEYDYATNFNEDGLAIVEKRGLKGVIDTTGKVVLPLRYETVYADLSQDGYLSGLLPGKEQGMALANVQKEYYGADLKEVSLSHVKYLISANGANLIPFCTKEGRMGYYNRVFEEVIPAQYTKATAFSEGAAWVRD